MAQELLQMVQSNPEIHGPMGIYEAYRRMYAALGVDNVESLLQPPQQPQPPMPVDAGLENSGLLMGAPAQAFKPQNHRAHVDVHRNLFLTEVVKENPAVQASIISHCMQHLQFMAAEMAQQQLPPELMQQQQQIEQAASSGQMPPQQAQMMLSQIMTQQEQFSAPILAQLVQEFLLSIGQGSEEDPLVQIRQRELDLRAQELEADQDNFETKEAARAEEKLLENEIQKQRIAMSKEISDDKMDLAFDRLKQQADLKLLELNQKFGG